MSHCDPYITALKLPEKQNSPVSDECPREIGGG